MNIIETKNLTKKYKDKTAVDAINLTVEEGELFSLLGVNGAGKTTTIRMLSCLSEPTSGEAFVDGKNVNDDKGQIKKIIGVSPQDTAVAEKLTVRENLEFMAEIHYSDKETIKEKVDNIISIFNLSEVENQRSKTLSGGWKRKLSIAMALISNPKILFLDEPTLGLDVLARRELWRAIEALKGKMTIILTTHYMEEAEHLSDRIGIMISGKIVACGNLSEIENAAGKPGKGLEEAFVTIAESGVASNE